MKDYGYNYDAGENLRKKHAFTNVRRKLTVRRSEPNKVERKLWKALGSSFEYTGHGSFKIDNLKPDFISQTRKLVIEVYGDYFHKDEPIQKTMQRISRFERHGWRVIIIWEHEVNDPIKLRRKLALI
jgi:very-short-patch-repair endonuclease